MKREPYVLRAWTHTEIELILRLRSENVPYAAISARLPASTPSAVAGVVYRVRQAAGRRVVGLDRYTAAREIVVCDRCRHPYPRPDRPNFRPLCPPCRETVRREVLAAKRSSFESNRRRFRPGDPQPDREARIAAYAVRAEQRLPLFEGIVLTRDLAESQERFLNGYGGVCDTIGREDDEELVG